MANYDWMQNIEAARVLVTQVFPKILKVIPDAKLLIAGQHTEKIADLKTESVKLLNLKIEDIEGVKRAYRESGVLVAPLYGPGGSRLKILGAMGTKLPVVTTAIGIEGIDAVNKESVLFGDNPEELADLTIKLLNNRGLYNEIARNARKLVESKYSYEAIAQKLDQIYLEVSKNEKP
jgi:glycosyltransferase involved in cell wall biosynthesis